jgi:hypothetical protein
MGYWAERQRATNRLVRELATPLLAGSSVSGDQLHALAMLTWITKSHDGDDAGYVSRVKAPALDCILDGNDAKRGLEELASDVVKFTGKRGAAGLVTQHTGFTNFFNPYRNASRAWANEHRRALTAIYRAALVARSKEEREAIVRKVAKLPGIPKANHPDLLMHPEFYVTPLLFALDPEIRFPIINGNGGVAKLLRKLKVQNASLIEQFRAMTGMYGVGGIEDAADLDENGADLPDFVTTKKEPAIRTILKVRTDGRDLPLKDDADYVAVREAQTVAHRRIHNDLTNKLTKALARGPRLTEGTNACKFDAMVHAFDGKRDLLIEAKSSIEMPHLRMAVGQLFNYSFQLKKGETEPALAILVPDRPSPAALAFLDWVEVGALWFEGKALRTNTRTLKSIAQPA